MLRHQPDFMEFADRRLYRLDPRAVGGYIGLALQGLRYLCHFGNVVAEDGSVAISTAGKQKCCEAPRREQGREGGGGEPPRDCIQAARAQKSSQQKPVSAERAH